MTTDLKAAIDGILHRVTTGTPRVPGVSAIITDRTGNLYEGAAGERIIGGEAFTMDTTCAIFSTTKAITGTACLQLVEDGKLDLDAPAKNYAPAIGKLQVIEGFDAAGNPGAVWIGNPSALQSRRPLAISTDMNIRFL